MMDAPEFTLARANGRKAAEAAIQAARPYAAHEQAKQEAERLLGIAYDESTSQYRDAVRVLAADRERQQRDADNVYYHAVQRADDELRRALEQQE